MTSGSTADEKELQLIPVLAILFLSIVATFDFAKVMLGANDTDLSYSNLQPCHCKVIFVYLIENEPAL